MRVHDLGDIGVEAVAVGSLGEWPGIDRPPRDLRLTGPLRFRAFGIEPKASSPSSKATSIPEIRGDPSARKVAIVLCLCPSKSPRTR